MAEREGFEPPVEFPPRRFSRPEPSTTRPPLLRTVYLKVLPFRLVTQAVVNTPGIRALLEETLRPSRIQSQQFQSDFLQIPERVLPLEPPKHEEGVNSECPHRERHDQGDHVESIQNHAGHESPSMSSARGKS